jgi:NADH-quinone oxidoreductase subunit N
VKVSDLFALLPLIVLAGSSILVMLVIAVRRNHLLSLLLTLVGLALSFISLPISWTVAPRRVTSLLVVDRYALFYIGLVVAATFVVAVLSYEYFKKREGDPEELYVLLLLAALGSAVLAASDHFVSFFLGLEVLSVALYALSAYPRERKLPVEAGIKYLVLAASSAAFLLFGMALVYAQVGSMDFTQLGAWMEGGGNFHQTLILVGLALVITGFGFKLALVPFHLWTPDVYEGAPAPVTAFVATVSKGSVFALLMRFFYGSGTLHVPAIFLTFAILAITSMIAGNFLALLQNNIKRLLAYSSIAHMGYLIVAFLAAGSRGAEAAAFYLVAYFITILGAFGVVTVLSGNDREAELMDDYQGLFWRRPGLAVIFTLMLLSLAGIPLTAGFVGKFYIVAAGASSATWALILVLVLSSVFGLFYYLRVVVALYETVQTGISGVVTPARPLSLSGECVLVALAILLVWFGIYPAPMLNLVRIVVLSLT